MVGMEYDRDVRLFHATPRAALGAKNPFQRFPNVCSLARGTGAGIRERLPMGLALAPTDQACFS